MVVVVVVIVVVVVVVAAAAAVAVVIKREPLAYKQDSARCKKHTHLLYNLHPR